jgi:hypothetical protein
MENLISERKCRKFSESAMSVSILTDVATKIKMNKIYIFTFYLKIFIIKKIIKLKLQNL